MQIPIYHIDAFTDQVFQGNPAAVCPLERWLPDELMQKIALENALAETAFFTPMEDGFEIRWFTPEIEMDLCGHATLASAHVIARHLGYPLPVIQFGSQSGALAVRVEGELLTLDFPARKPQPCRLPQVILDAFPDPPLEALKARDYLLVYDDEEVVRGMQPRQDILNQIRLDPGGIIISAPGREADFVSRFFTPGASIFEDPVTGSAHCSLIPYWSERLGKQALLAWQVSARGGVLLCQDAGERVLMAGKALTYLEGTITI